MALRYYDKGYITAIADVARADLGYQSGLTLLGIIDAISWSHGYYDLPDELKITRDEARDFGASFARGC